MQPKTFLQVRGYPDNFFKTLYGMYISNQVPSYVVTYYRFDFERSNIDKGKFDIQKFGNIASGAYEDTGNYSGMKWQKILFFPLFGLQKISNSRVADERGVQELDNTTEFGFPYSFGFFPNPWDFVDLSRKYLNESDNGMEGQKFPLYRITDVQDEIQGFKNIYKIKTKSYHTTAEELEQHLSGIYAFSDYEKRIYQADQVIEMYKTIKNSQTFQSISNNLDNLTGYYTGV